VSKDLPNDRRVFDAGNDLDGTTTFTASFDVDTENSLQSLRPSHRCPALGGVWSSGEYWSANAYQFQWNADRVWGFNNGLDRVEWNDSLALPRSTPD
jgi:hypothetical protein